MSYFKAKVDEIEHTKSVRESTDALYDFKGEEDLFGKEEAQMNRRIDAERRRITGW